MKANLKGLHIRDQDLDFLRYLHAVKVATYEQIHRDVYSDICFDAVGNRLRKMENNRLISIEYNRPLLGSKRLVFITRSGFQLFEDKLNALQMELRSDAVNHDLALVDIRHRFVTLSRCKNYLTENQIQTWYPELRELNSDAMMDFKIKDDYLRLPVEYESSIKRCDRYQSFVTKYYEKDDLPVLLLIATTKSIVTAIQKIETERFNWKRPKIFYCLMSHFLDSDSSVFSNCHGLPFKLGDR